MTTQIAKGPGQALSVRLAACVLSWVLPLLLGLATPRAADFGNLVIVGDSITHGGGGYSSYRYPLFSHLETMQADYTFVGSNTGYYNGGTATTPDVGGVPFSNVHEGHWSWRASWMSGRLPLPTSMTAGGRGAGTVENWTGQTNQYALDTAGNLVTYTGTTYTPDTVVMLIGINDLNAGGTTGQLLADVESMVGQYQAANPAASIYLASVLPVGTAFGNYAALSTAVPEYNGLLAAAARGWSTAGSSVRFVDIATGFNANSGSMTYDNLHPNATGEAFIANRLSSTLLATQGQFDGTAIHVRNHSLEAPSGTGLSGTVDDWTFGGFGTGQSAGSFSPAQTSPGVFYSSPTGVDGNRVVYMLRGTEFGYAEQTLLGPDGVAGGGDDSVLAPNSLYTVTVAFGRRNGSNTDPWAGYQLSMLAGDTLVANKSVAGGAKGGVEEQSIGPAGAFTDHAWSFTTADDPAGYGDQLKLRIGRNAQAGSTGRYLDFDNVRVSVMSDVFTWDSAATDSAWSTAANWSGAVPGGTGAAAAVTADVAYFAGISSTVAAGGIGIDMAGNGGAANVGAVWVAGGSDTVRIGNSAAGTSGSLRLDGRTIDGVANTVLAATGGADLTIANTAAGSGDQTMGVVLGGSSNVVQAAASRTVTVLSDLSEASSGSSLTKTGAGTLVLGGSVGYTGGTTIAAGTLEISGGPLGGGTYAGTIANDGTLLLSTSTSQTLTGVVSGGGTIVKQGAGTTLTLGGANTFTGGVTVSAGTLRLDANAGAGSGTVTLGDANTGSADVALLINNNSDPNNAIVVSASGSGTVTIGSDGGGAGSNPTLFGGTLTLNRATTLQGSSTDRTTYTGRVTGTVGTLTFSGARTTLSNPANDFSGDVVINAGAILQGDASDVIPNAAAVIANGRLQLNAASETIGSLAGSGTVQAITAGTRALVIGADDTSTTFSGVISNNAGTVAIGKIGTGTLALSATNSYTGGTTVSAGTLAANAASAVGSGPTTLAAGATLRVGHANAVQTSTLSAASGSTVTFTAAAGTSYTIGGLAGGGTVDATGNSLLVGGNNASTTFSGALTADSLTKQGSGTLTVSGANTLGSLTVSGGTLLAMSPASLGSGSVTLAGGRLQHAGSNPISTGIVLSGAAGSNTIDAGMAVEYLVIGGGGGGGGRDVGGGGGAGGYRSSVIGELSGGSTTAEPVLFLAPGSYSVVVGGGGAGGTDATNNRHGKTGGNSTFGPITSLGGGGGAGWASPTPANGGSGGGGDGITSMTGQAGTAGQGLAGGNGGGGGGGAGAPGANSDAGRHGGAGIASAITGTSVVRGGGGGGAAHRTTTGAGLLGSGGSGGGGAAQDANGSAGQANTGGGGGASRNTSRSGGTGGSGVVIVRYAGEAAALGGSVNSSSVAGHTVHSFTAVGSSTFTLAAGLNRTISGDITGSGGFTFNSPGTSLTLSGTNSYQGGTIVSGGTLAAGSTTALGTGPLTTAAGGTVTFTTPGTNTYEIPSIAGGGTLSAGSNALVVGSDNSSTSYTGSITAASLTKQGSGALSLSGNNVLAGTTLSAGALIVKSNAAFGSGPLTISAGRLRTDPSTTLANAITLSGDASSVTLDMLAPTVEYLVVGGGGGGDNTISGTAYGAGGGGGQVLQGSVNDLLAGSYSITVGAGGTAPGGRTSTAGQASTAFGIEAAGGLAGSSASNGQGGASGSGFAGGTRSGFAPGGGGGAGGTGGNGNSTSPRRGGAGGAGVSSSITGSAEMYGGGGGGNEFTTNIPGAGGSGGGGAGGQPGVANTGGGGGGDRAGGSGIVIVRYQGEAIATGGTISQGTGSAAGYTLHTFTDVGSATLAFTGISSTLAGDIDGTGGFTWDSVARLTLSGTNTYSGGTILSAGTLTAGSNAAFGSGTITLGNGTTLDLANFTIANTIVNNGGTILNAGNYGGGQSVDGDATFDGDVGGTVTIGSGGVGRFRGQVGGRIEIASGGIAEFDDQASVGAGAEFVNDGLLRANRATDMTIGRPISGSGSLQKQGVGRLVLSGTNTYSGGTAVEAGTLVVNGSILGDVSLSAGSRLGGSGSIAGGVGGAGIFGPGNSPGVTSVGSVDPSGGLGFEFEITGPLPAWADAAASVNDVIRITSGTPFTSALSGANSISVLLDVAGLDPAAPGTYTGGFFTDTAADFTSAIANATFEYWVAGEFGTVGDRQQFATGSGGGLEWYTRMSAYDPELTVQWRVVPTTADFGSGDVNGYSTQFVVVPEPGSLALAGLGFAGLAALLRRRATRPGNA